MVIIAFVCIKLETKGCGYELYITNDLYFMSIYFEPIVVHTSFIQPLINHQS